MIYNYDFKGMNLYMNSFLEFIYDQIIIWIIMIMNLYDTFHDNESRNRFYVY